MRSGASTPEELESLFEDAFVIDDFDALAQLFDPGGVLITNDGRVEARGGEQIALLATAIHARGYSYLADPRRVIRARQTALVTGARTVSVMRRGADRRWLYLISLLDTDNTTEGSNR